MKSTVWIPALVTFISAIVASLITLLGAYWNLKALEEQIRLQNDQLQKQQKQIDDKFLFEKKSAFIEMENLYHDISEISKGINGDLRRLNHKYNKEKGSRVTKLKEFSNVKTSDKITKEVRTIYSYILKNAKTPIELTNNEKIHLSSEARQAIRKMNQAYKDLAYIITLRKKSVGTWHALNMNGSGMLHSFYDMYFKKYLDVLGHDLERLRREAYSLKDVSSLKDWKKGVEIVPSKGRLMFKNHRFPVCEAHYEKLLIAKEPKEQLQFICESGLNSTEIALSKAKIFGVQTALSIWKINMLEHSISYYDLFHEMENPEEGVHFLIPEP